MAGTLWFDAKSTLERGYVLEREGVQQTDPNNPDSDADGLRDGDEVKFYRTNPIRADTDGDSLSDFDELRSWRTNPIVTDTDVDGLTDGDEVNLYHTDPANVDTDEDGLSDGGEVQTWKTDPLKVDTDGDGLQDGRELFILNTNPLKADTDGDTFSDGEEIAAGTNPRDPISSLVQKHREYTAVEVEFRTQVGLSYRLQALSRVGVWEPVGGKITGTGQVQGLLLSTREAPMKLWRVILAN